MGGTRVAELIMLNAHNKDHSGREITMATARQDAWIVNARKLAKDIVKNCVRCRYIRKELQGQKMGNLPSIIQVPSPPFTNISVDLTGPFLVKSMVNKRASMKVWVVVFICLNVKAIKMYIAPGYSTEDFMIAYESHVSENGIPAFVYSDRGSQLTAAKTEVCFEVKYEWSVIANNASKQGTTWKFCPVAAQWRNGSAESFVKKVKRSIYHLYSTYKLNYAEFDCAMKRISSILNDRPVSAQRTKTDSPDEDFLSPLTPNMLLTGRSQNGPPAKSDSYEETFHERLSFIKELEDVWWNQFKVQHFSSLVPTRKWLMQKRNMKVGDVVLIQYKTKSFPGTYRLGIINQTIEDSDGLVRTCVVNYKLFRSGTEIVKGATLKSITVPVQNLVIILPVEE